MQKFRSPLLKTESHEKFKFLFKACSWSEYSRVCFAHCQEFLFILDSIYKIFLLPFFLFLSPDLPTI